MPKIKPTYHYFIEYHDHPDGIDRGGAATETHEFVVEGNKVTHKYDLDGCDEPESFGLDEGTLARLTTKDDAISFVAVEIATLKDRLAQRELLLDQLRAETTEYTDAADYSSYEDSEEDEDSDEEDE